MKLILCAPLFVLLAIGSSHARPVQNPSDRTLQAEDLTSRVRSGSKATYLELLRELFPDLQENGTAHRTIPLGSLLEPDDKQVITADIAFNFTPYWINSEGRRLLLLWVVLTDDDANQSTPYQGGAVVLAVFRLEPTVKLLDAMRVEADRFTDPWGKSPILRLNARSDAFIFENSHSNSGESYNDIVLLFVDAGRFKVIANPFIYNFTACGATYSETPTFRVVADPGNVYPKLLVKVILKKKAERIFCEPQGRSYTRTYQGFYRWNRTRGKYESHSRQLDRFDEFNKKWLSS